MSREDDFERGLVNRRAVLGEEWVQRSLDRATTFTADYQNLITRYAWHDIWSRPGLPHKARRMMVLAVTLSLGRWEEFELHVRAALTAKDDSRLSPDELKEVLLQNAIYAGVPAANTAFNLAQGILREVAGEIGYVLEPAEVRGRICLAAVRWSGGCQSLDGAMPDALSYAAQICRRISFKGVGPGPWAAILTSNFNRNSCR